MSINNADEAALQAVRKLEKVRIVAIHDNDADTMAAILDQKFIYINGTGKIFDKDSYTAAVRSHQLTYSSDLQLTKTDHRVDGDLVILVGMMLGHARLDREQEVYHLRNMRVWRARGAEWKLFSLAVVRFLAGADLVGDATRANRLTRRVPAILGIYSDWYRVSVELLNLIVAPVARRGREQRLRLSNRGQKTSPSNRGAIRWLNKAS